MSADACPSKLVGGGSLKSVIVKHTVVIAGHKTSVSLEDAFWKCLKHIASDRHLTLSQLVTAIDAGRTHPNLCSALRLFVLDHYRTMVASAAAPKTCSAHDPQAPDLGTTGHFGGP